MGNVISFQKGFFEEVTFEIGHGWNGGRNSTMVWGNGVPRLCKHPEIRTCLTC
jgi:hypothetical protein